MNTKAIYTVHENGKEHYFFSEHAGGFSYPFAVADFLHSLKGVLNDPMSPQKGLCAAPMLEQMKGNYLFPEEIEGKELFTAVKKEQMFQLAVETSKLSHVIAYSHGVDEQALGKLQAKCAEEVKRINGAVRFGEAYQYQQGDRF